MKNLMRKMVVLLGMCAPGLVAWGGDCPCDELRINEICYAPTEGGSQWVEIVNTGDEVVFPNGAELVGNSGAFTLPGELGGIPARGIVLVVFDGADASENRYECAPGAAAVLHGPAEGMFGNPVGFCGLYRVTDVHTPETLLDFLAWGGEPGAAAADAVAKGVWNSTSSYLVTGAGGETGPYVAMQEGGSFARSSETFVGWNVLGLGDVTFGQENYSLAAPVLHYPPAGDWGEEEPSYFSWFPVMNASSYDFQLADSEDFSNLLVEESGLAGGVFEHEGGLGLSDGVYYWRVRAINGEEFGPWCEGRRLEKGYYFLTFSEADAEAASRKHAGRAEDGETATAKLALHVKIRFISKDGSSKLAELPLSALLVNEQPFSITDEDGKPATDVILSPGQFLHVSSGMLTLTLAEKWKTAIATMECDAPSATPGKDSVVLNLVAGQLHDVVVVLNSKRKVLTREYGSDDGEFKRFGAQKDSGLLATGTESGWMCTRFDNEGDQGWDCPHNSCHPGLANAFGTLIQEEQESWYCWAAALRMLCNYYGDSTWNRDGIVHATKGHIGFASDNSGCAEDGGSHVFDNESTVMGKATAQFQSRIEESLAAEHPLIASDGGHAVVVYGYQWVPDSDMRPAIQVYAANTDNKGGKDLKYLSKCGFERLYYAKKKPKINKMPSKYSKDSDRDGVLDADEDYFGTDRAKADTDGDGISDKEEIASWKFPRYLNGKYNADVQQGGHIGRHVGLVGFPASAPNLSMDTDGGGINDGAEDVDKDGVWDADDGETDVFDPLDDKQLDVVFCIDTTGSMGSMINSVKSKVQDIVKRYQDSREGAQARFAVVQFKDVKEDGFPPTTVQGFTSDGAAVIRAVNSLGASGGGDTLEDVNDALMHCLGLAGWRSAPIKRRIILMGDAGDNGRGVSLAQVQAACQRTETEVTRRGVRRRVAKEAFSPVSIITLPVGGNSSTIRYFQEIADATDGACLPVGSASDTGEAIMAALEAIETTPVVELAVEGEWGAKHIVADATGTTDPRGCGIVKYEWDWEGDGTYDEWSYKAVAEKDYPAGFQGKVRVRATSATGDKGTRTVIIVAPEFLDVTTMTDMALASARLDPNTGAIVCDITLGNKTDTVKTLKDKFWFVLPSTSTIFLASPDGTMEDGTPYVDITAAVEAALPSVGNGDLCLDPGETVVLKDAIAIYSYDRSVPTGFMFAVWADPPPDAAGSGSSVGGKVKKSIVGYKLDRKAEEASLTLEDGEEMRHGFMYSTNLVDWSQTPVPLTNPAVFIRVGSPE